MYLKQYTTIPNKIINNKKSNSFIGWVLMRFPTKVAIQSHIESVVLFLLSGRLTTPLFVIKYHSFVFSTKQRNSLTLHNKYVIG